MANKKITDLMSGTPVRDSLLESAIDISGTMDSRKVKAGLVADLASANVAAPYDDTTTYAIGQYCLYEGNIYRCIAITTGAFDATAWTQIVVTGEYRRVVELLSAEYAQLTPAEQNNGTIYVKTDEETTAADIPYSAGVSVGDKLATIPPLVKSVLLTSSMTCNYADSSTIGYRSTTGDKVDITGITGYPTGKTILGVVVEYAYCGSVGEYYKVAQLNIVNNETWANSKVGGTVRFGVRVYYLDN